MKKDNTFRYFYTPTNFAEKNLLVCDGMGCETKPNFFIDRGSYNNHLLMLCTKGTIYVEQFSKKHSINDNKFIILDLRYPHKYYFKKSESSEILWFHFRGVPITNILDSLHNNNLLPYISKTENIEKEIEKLFNLKGQELEISNKIYSMLTTLLKSPIEKIANKNNEQTLFQEKVEQYIQNNIYSITSLSELSKYMNLSEGHFCRVFKKEFNTRPFNYINKVKIELAKQILLNTNDTMSELSTKLNFYDQSYFIKIFKNIVGCTPKQYRVNKMN